jgi:hypothetical protein
MANYIPITTVTVGSGGATTIDFNNIPQTYTDLIVNYSTRANANTNYLTLKFNGSSSGYSDKAIYGDGSTAGGTGNTGGAYTYGMNNNSTYTASSFASGSFYISNYASSNSKVVSNDSVQETNATQAYAWLQASLWANSAPINSITLTSLSGSFVQYSTATLYGIRKY